MVNAQKNTYSYTTIIGSETSEMEDIIIPATGYGGYLEFNAADFQNHIHELYQTAPVVVFALESNLKDFRMITQGSQGDGPSFPRHLIFYPSEQGIKFSRNNPAFADIYSVTDTDISLPAGTPIVPKDLNKDDAESSDTHLSGSDDSEIPFDLSADRIPLRESLDSDEEKIMDCKFLFFLIFFFC